MKISILSIFPNFFNEFIDVSIIKRAVSKKSVEIEVIDIRDYSSDKNKRIDDKPCGGGPGLIMQCQPIVDCLKDIKKENSKVFYMSPKGQTYNQKKARELSKEEHIILLCGHYEGIDERILDYVDEQISIGDYILTGGEIPAMIVSDSVIRLLDGAITEESSLDESFENGLLEYPQYTLPRVYEGREVPAVLFSGNHEAISKWRKKESLRITKEKRINLFKKYNLNKEEKRLLIEIENNEVGDWEKQAIENNTINKKLES